MDGYSTEAGKNTREVEDRYSTQCNRFEDGGGGGTVRRFEDGSRQWQSVCSARVRLARLSRRLESARAVLQ